MKDFNIPSGSLCFVDTNIWLYAFIRTEKEKNEIAIRIIEDFEIVMSTQIINELCVNLIKKVNFSEEKICRLIESFYKRYSIGELSREVLLTAISAKNISFLFGTVLFLPALWIVMRII